jgi:hypothetical protein
MYMYYENDITIQGSVSVAYNSATSLLDDLLLAGTVVF